GCIRVRGPGDDDDVGHRGDAGQSLASETEAAHAGQVVGSSDLGCGMSGDCEREVAGLDAAAVVTDPDTNQSTTLGDDVDPGRAGVEGVLAQLLDRRGGTLDNLTGGDGVGDRRRQRMDASGDHSTPSAWATRLRHSASWLGAAGGSNRPGSRGSGWWTTGCAAAARGGGRAIGAGGRGGPGGGTRRGR